MFTIIIIHIYIKSLCNKVDDIAKSSIIFALLSDRGASLSTFISIRAPGGLVKERFEADLL